MLNIGDVIEVKNQKFKFARILAVKDLAKTFNMSVEELKEQVSFRYEYEVEVLTKNLKIDKRYWGCNNSRVIFDTEIIRVVV